MGDVSYSDANQSWIKLISEVYSRGGQVSPRGMPCREILGYQSQVDMCRPVVTVSARKIGRRFLPAEAWWILSGRNDVSSIAPYSKGIAKFSNDGKRFDGAYGVKVVDQLRYVCDSLDQDPDTRQAIINIWRENPRPSKDVPCTVSCQFLIRDRMIHCVDTMRSSDCWLGWPYDVFNFSMLSAYVLLHLRERDHARFDPVGLGSLTLTAGSQHIYERDFPGINSVFNDTSHTPYDPFDVDGLHSPEDLIGFLENMRDQRGGQWLRELT